jgi:hypothetical protein
MHSGPRRGLISDITSRDIAGMMLDEYFDLVEQILEQILEQSACHRLRFTGTVGPPPS